jgi:ribosomal protein S18 acetylase RimI-like enzyme
MQAIPGCELVESEGLSLHHAFPANPMFKGAWRTRLSVEETETRIDEVLDWFEQRGSSHFFWWTDPQTQPADLAERLLKRGFDGNLEGEPGMVLDLDDLNENIQPNRELSIYWAVNQERLEDWQEAFAEAFGAAKADGKAWADATLAAGGVDAPWQLYVGYLDGKPVATSILFTGAGVAGIYGVGTIPSARNQGIGSRMTLIPLQIARKAGLRQAVLFSSRLGYPVYTRLGFREVDCKIGIYIKERD